MREDQTMATGGESKTRLGLSEIMTPEARSEDPT
jgi:hypothetical protein